MPVGAVAQRDLPVTRTAPGAYAAFTADNLGNLYLLSKENQLKKLNVKGDSMGVFNDVRRYGKLYSINAANPLRTLLYYKDFRTVVVLDRLMNPVNVIDLRKQNMFQVRAVAPAYDNNVWIFDEQESKLKKVDEEGKVVLETPDLRLVLQDALSPTRLFDQNGYVYAYDPERGMFIFDYYGAMKNKLTLLHWDDVQVIGSEIIGRKEGKVLQYIPGTLDIKETVIPSRFQQYKDIFITPQGIYVLEEAGVKLYSFSGF
ncbi:MAG: hypothetical protein EAZ17_03070 [Sphingobacteriales bacterium]|nr:MAG: hypothetical protein EAZ17_03070 [Sphingobacteriales bacterium]